MSNGKYNNEIDLHPVDVRRIKNIDLAPKDGTPILGVANGVCYVCWYGKTEKWEFCVLPNNRGKLSFEPSHFYDLDIMQLSNSV